MLYQVKVTWEGEQATMEEWYEYDSEDFRVDGEDELSLSHLQDEILDDLDYHHKPRAAIELRRV